MSHHNLHMCVALVGCCLTFGVAAAMPPQAATASTRSTQAPAPSREGAPRVCFDTLFYASLPGKTNYCLGLRDWDDGQYGTGLELLKLAAGWGNKNAQYTLGLIYYNGHHVQTNRALGIAWLELANQRHNDPQIERVTRAAVKWATHDERKQAKQLYRRMRLLYGDKVAATRAWHHLRHWQRHRGWNSGSVMVYPRQKWALLQAGLCGGTSPGMAHAAQALNAASQAAGNKRAPRHGPCASVSFALQNHMVSGAAQTYFRGWIGHVTVEPLQQVPAPATSSGH